MSWHTCPQVSGFSRLHGPWHASVLIMLFAVIGVGGPRQLRSQGIELADDAPPALKPEVSVRRFQVPPGFRVELVAGEPQLADPVAMAFDARGRILVCEIHGYNLEGYLDILELNERGELDTAVRRILANEDAIQRAQEQQYGTVKLLSDLDNDLRYEHVSVLADHLPPCYGVVPARDGVLVLCAPDILFLADRDGDGLAEVRETLFTGFGVGEMWTRINNPRWGVDNWIYAVSGAGSGGTITGPHLERPCALSSVCFRFRSDGTALEAASGVTHGFGQAIDDWGDRFLCTNQQHALHVIPVEHQYLVRNPYYAAPDLTRNISTYGHPARVYPTSQPDPWRRARAADPAWVRFYGEAEATASGLFTAASGQTIYQGALFPPEYHGNHFSVDNAQNLIHRCLLDPDGVSFRARRPVEQERSEFLTSTEQWFRPVNLMTGPDGALYVVDMYRDIIEDYSAIPRHLQQRYVRSLIAGSDKGRIWRIIPDTARTPSIPDLTRLTAEELVEQLMHANQWQRHTAQRLLVERHDVEVVSLLHSLAREGVSPQSRLHALYTLDGLSALTADTLIRALQDSHFAVVTQAVRLSESRPDDGSQLRRTLLSLVDHAHPRVQLQLALSLGQDDSVPARDALIQIALRHGHDPWIATGVLSSAAESAHQLISAIVQDVAQPPRARNLLHPLASIAGARRDPAQLGELLATLGSLAARPDPAADDVLLCLQGLEEGLGRGQPTAMGTQQMVDALRQMLHHDHDELRSRAMRVAGLLGLPRIPEMSAVYQEARQTALDDSEPLERRQEAVRLLATAPWEELQSAAEALLEAWQPLELQLAAVEALATVSQPQVTDQLLENFATYTPTLREAVISAIFARAERLPHLLDAIEQDRVPPSSVDATRRDQLLTSRDRDIVERAARLLSSGVGTARREEVLRDYHAALQLPRNDQRGKEVFTQQCSKCHKLDNEGYEVGPDLATARTRADETLLSDVLDPSSQLTVGYSQYTVLTQDGRVFTGVLAAETATSITLRAEEGKDTVILRKDIEEMKASAVSMMPEDLEKTVSVQDLADLLGFLRITLGPPPPSVLVLLDEDEQILSALNEGEGIARWETTDCFAGRGALAVGPPQRFSATIPDWAYRIREHPEPGEFRYLRFAWKQPRGQGVMLELAADGQWPAAEQSLYRYYSGSNSTGWAATEINAAAPSQWTLVTRDLWQDFGSFTLTGMAPTALGDEALFDRIELLRSLE